MNANWTSISGRTSALAPTSSSVTGRPGPGGVRASAGRWMPCARLMWAQPAASATPVEPLQTSACARPSPTAIAACTIEACGASRTALIGDGSLAIDSGASTISIPSPPSPSAAAGPNRITLTPWAAAMRAPAATSEGPRSAPLASTATTVTPGAPRGRAPRWLNRRPLRAAGEWPGASDQPSMFVIVVVLGRSDDLAPGVGPADRADAMRTPRRVAARAGIQRRREDLVVRAALRRTAVGLLLLGGL